MRPTATWAQLWPTHRLTVIAKTPVLVALGLFLAGGRLTSGPGPGATIVLASLLWALLYGLNEAYDLELEDGVAPPPGAIVALYIAVGMLIVTTWVLSLRLALIFLLMAAGQLAYCAPAFRLKRLWWPVLLLSGVVNPYLRIECGAIWGTAAAAPAGIVLPLVVHLASTIRTRALQRDRDRRHGYRVAPRGIEAVGALCTAVGIAGGAWLCLIGTYPRVLLVLAPLPIGFSLYAWSGRAVDIGRLRRGWWLFAVGSIFVLTVLLRGR